MNSLPGRRGKGHRRPAGVTRRNLDLAGWQRLVLCDPVPVSCEEVCMRRQAAPVL